MDGGEEADELAAALGEQVVAPKDHGFVERPAAARLPLNRPAPSLPCQRRMLT